MQKACGETRYIKSGYCAIIHMNMSIKQALHELENNNLNNEQFLELIQNCSDSLSNKDFRVFAKKAFDSRYGSLYKMNPYVLNLIVNKIPLRLESRSHSHRFKLDKFCAPTGSYSYCCSIFSTYGQFVFACSLSRGSIYRWTIAPKSNIYNYGINVVEPNSFLDLKEVVFLDLETTGLNPLTDDVIEIALYDPSNGKEYSRLLPLNRCKTIPSEIESLTGITNDMIKELPPIKSQELDELIDEFDLKRKKILIWAGMNMFDTHFLASLFINVGNKNFKYLKFASAMDIIKEYSDVNFNSLSKDYLASYLNINSNGSHRALSDCKIETEIYKTLYSRKK